MLDEPLVDLLRVLARCGVEFVLVGGVACVVHGAPVVTFDLDVLYRRTPENAGRLLAALGDLDAIFRGDSRKLRPNATHLGGPGHLLLATRLGPLDVLGTIGAGTTYDDVIGDALTLTLEDFTFRVASLERIIVSKEQAGRPKDLAVLPVLRATLAEVERGRDD
jgi:hypothetical protein